MVLGGIDRPDRHGEIGIRWTGVQVIALVAVEFISEIVRRVVVVVVSLSRRLRTVFVSS